MKSNPPTLPAQFLLELLGVPQGDRDFLATLEFFHIHYQLSNGCCLEAVSYTHLTLPTNSRV